MMKHPAGTSEAGLRANRGCFRPQCGSTVYQEAGELLQTHTARTQAGGGFVWWAMMSAARMWRSLTDNEDGEPLEIVLVLELRPQEAGHRREVPRVVRDRRVDVAKLRTVFELWLR